MKRSKIIYWSTTIFIFLFEGIVPALTSQTELAKEGIRHLGYPEYFGTVLAVFKVIGTLILIIPPIGNRLKEWAYAGFFFDFVFAFISYLAVDGLSESAFFPLLVLVILAFSYIHYRKLIPKTVS